MIKKYTKKIKEKRKQQKEYIQKKYKRIYHLTCIKCKKKISIKITRGNEKYYTEERIKRFICLNCR